MATTKVTITLDADELRTIRDLVASGRAASVSAFVRNAMRVALQARDGGRSTDRDRRARAQRRARNA